MPICYVISGLVVWYFGGTTNSLAHSANLAGLKIEPIYIRGARDHPGGQIYIKSDGSRLKYKGSPIAAGGRCPDEFIPGTVTRFGPETYKLEVPGATCVIHENVFVHSL